MALAFAEALGEQLTGAGEVDEEKIGIRLAQPVAVGALEGRAGQDHRLTALPPLGERQGHYMPASLLDSQLAALEAPQAPAERCLTVDIAAAPEVLCATVATFLRTF